MFTIQDCSAGRFAHLMARVRIVAWADFASAALTIYANSLLCFGFLLLFIGEVATQAGVRVGTRYGLAALALGRGVLCLVAWQSGLNTWSMGALVLWVWADVLPTVPVFRRNDTALTQNAGLIGAAALILLSQA